MFEDEERKKLLTYKESLEEFLAVVDALRSGEIYSHLSCERKFYILRGWLIYSHIPIAGCFKRGCGNVYSTDGLWKLSYPTW